MSAEGFAAFQAASDRVDESSAGQRDEPSCAAGPTVAGFFDGRSETCFPKDPDKDSAYIERALSHCLAAGNPKWSFVPYVSPQKRRLSPTSITKGASCDMRILVGRFVDAQGERREKRVTHARKGWHDEAETVAKIAKLVDALHPFVWRDSAGYLLAWVLPSPFVIATTADLDRWRTFYMEIAGRHLANTYGVPLEPEGAELHELFPGPRGQPDAGDPRNVGVLSFVHWPPAPPQEEKARSRRSGKKSAGRAAPPRAKSVDLTAITRAAYERGQADGERAAVVLADASDDMPDLVCWTTYDGDRHKTHGGERQERTFQAFGDSLVAYSKRIAPKGARWFMGATSINGRCRDEDIEAIHLPSLDCDGKGEWTRFREVLDEAGLGYVAQRSASHTPAVPKWHATPAFARPWSGEKRHWRVIWRWIIGYFAAVAGLQVEWDRTVADPETGELRPAPLFGFDHSTDRLGQPIFPAARRDSTSNAPETIVVPGRALDLDEFLTSTGFDRAWLTAEDPYEPADASTIEPERGLFALAFAEARMLGPRIGTRGYAAECPNEHEHSPGGSRFDSSTIIFDPGPGQALGYFKCSHEHCSHLIGEAVLKLLDEEAVERARKAWIAALRGAKEDDGRPLIQLGTELHASVDLAVAALKGDPELYQRGGRLVHVIPISHEEAEQSADATGLPTLVEGSPTMRDMPRSIVCMRLSKHARFERFDARDMDWVPCRPDGDLVDMVHDLGQWPWIRPLLQIVEAPVLLSNLSVLQERGYHAATGLLYAPSREFPKAPERPTLEDAQAALERLRYPFLDFPFASEGARLGPIAAAMSIACRPAIKGHVPGFMFDASAPGSGKSLITDAISVIASGRECPRISYPVHGRRAETDEQEMQKILAGYADAGATFFSFDNVPTHIPVGGGSLDKALTQQWAEFRLLGKTGNPRRRWRAVVMATANNPMFHDDGAARRWLQCRLEPMEEPDKRDPGTFREADLLGFLQKNHPQLAIDLLTIARAYLFAVRADPSQRCAIAHWPSFERWTEIVPASIAWVSGYDVTATRVQASASPKTGYLAIFLELWEELLGTEARYARDALEAIYAGRGVHYHEDGKQTLDKRRKRFVEMVEAMHGLSKPAPGQDALDADRLGRNVLRTYKGRPAGDPARRLVGEADRKGVMRWTVARAGAAARVGDFAGDPCDV